VDFIKKLVDELGSSNLDANDIESWKTYVNEAKWGWDLISPSVMSLPTGSQIYELGAGPQALSAQVAAQGMVVTAIEPSGSGFSIMAALGERVRKLASKSEITYTIIDAAGEDYVRKESFDFAFSVNVMEHVVDISSVLDNVLASLKTGATYQFVCPNYAFPFEPHFSFPTLIHKGLTDKLISKSAIKASKASDPQGLWNSLNWITHRKVKKWAKDNDNVSITFSNRALQMYVTRAQNDPIFVQRHRALSQIAMMINPLLLVISQVTPKSISPFIDVKITKLN
jgi:SAM-dependent methyltransferase